MSSYWSSYGRYNMQFYQVESEDHEADEAYQPPPTLVFSRIPLELRQIIVKMATQQPYSVSNYVLQHVSKDFRSFLDPFGLKGNASTFLTYEAKVCLFIFIFFVSWFELTLIFSVVTRPSFGGPWNEAALCRALSLGLPLGPNLPRSH